MKTCDPDCKFFNPAECCKGKFRTGRSWLCEFRFRGKEVKILSHPHTQYVLRYKVYVDGVQTQDLTAEECIRYLAHMMHSERV